MFSFNFQAVLEKVDTSVLVIFISSSDNKTDLLDSVESSLQANLCPELCVFVGTWESKKTINALISNSEMIEALHRWLPVGKEDSYFSIFLEPDRSISSENYCFKQFKLSEFWELTIRRGAATLFQRNGALLKAGPMWHYIKPSGKHTNVFIRAANVLIESSEIEFLSIALFRLFKGEITTIYCDTSGIHSLAFALKRLIELARPTDQPVCIKSFKSYKGYIETRMDDIVTSVILISASFSGDLDKILVKDKNADPTNIVTLYYAGSESTIKHMKVLCCLQRDSDITNSTKFENEDPHIGKYVKSGSMGLQIKGDTFLAEPATIDSHLIVSEDCPKWLADFQTLLFGTGAIRSLKTNRSGEQRYENWLQLERAMRNGLEFRKKLSLFLADNLPVRCSQIIIGSSQDVKLKRAVEIIIREFYPRTICGYFNGNALKNCPDNQQSTDPIVALIPVIRSGQQILSLSRALRNIAGKRPIHYIVPIAMVESEGALSEINANLSYGRSGKSFNRVSTMLTAFMPASRMATAWHSEFEWLKKYNPSGSLRSRFKTLSSEDWSNLGTTDCLYLPNNNRSKLTLRKGFAFDRRIDKNKTLSSDELYFTVSAVLHNLRKVKNSGALRQDLSRHTVIDAGNFDRYNDGAIQAAILRAALQRELDYSGCANRSGRIIAILRFALSTRDQPHGEAAAEMIMALLSGRLRIHVESVKEFRGIFKNVKINKNSFLKELCQHAATQNI